MLEDVYVARKRNRFGEPYGFVKFSNVKDVTKMTKALNAVCFGHFRVRASVARFDRNASGAERCAEEGRHVLSKGAATRKEGYHSPATFIGGDSRIKGRDGVGITDMAKEGSEVQVGDVVNQTRESEEAGRSDRRSAE
jgi:hypothetical protein